MFSDLFRETHYYLAPDYPADDSFTKRLLRRALEAGSTKPAQSVLIGEVVGLPYGNPDYELDEPWAKAYEDLRAALKDLAQELGVGIVEQPEASQNPPKDPKSEDYKNFYYRVHLKSLHLHFVQSGYYSEISFQAPRDARDGEKRLLQVWLQFHGEHGPVVHENRVTETSQPGRTAESLGAPVVLEPSKIGPAARLKLALEDAHNVPQVMAAMEGRGIVLKFSAQQLYLQLKPDGTFASASDFFVNSLDFGKFKIAPDGKGDLIQLSDREISELEALLPGAIRRWSAQSTQIKQFFERNAAGMASFWRIPHLVLSMVGAGSLIQAVSAATESTLLKSGLIDEETLIGWHAPWTYAHGHGWVPQGSYAHQLALASVKQFLVSTRGASYWRHTWEHLAINLPLLFRWRQGVHEQVSLFDSAA